MNNTKTWFDENRNRYEKIVKPQFVHYCLQMQQSLSDLDERFGQVHIRKSIFRINRDIRFSKDKTPYKTFFSVIFSPYGSKSMQAGGLYVEIGPENGSFYSGHYMPEKEELYKIRQRIASNPKAFRETLTEKAFKDTFGTVKGEQNKRIDAPFMPLAKDIPEILNKQFYIQHSFEPERCMEPDFLEYGLSVYRKSLPFNRFLLGDI